MVKEEPEKGYITTIPSLVKLAVQLITDENLCVRESVSITRDAAQRKEEECKQEDYEISRCQEYLLCMTNCNIDERSIDIFADNHYNNPVVGQYEKEVICLKYSMEDQVRQFCDAWQELNMIYEDYARSVDVPYTSLYILSLITRIDGCTQKTICEKTFLPRQTVNTIITGFYKKNWITLQELPEDRRIKAIYLTETGKEYAGKIIPQIRRAELEAMEKLTEEQRTALLEGIRIYRDAFRAACYPARRCNYH